MSLRWRGVMHEPRVSVARTSSSAVVRLWPVFDWATRRAWPLWCAAGVFRLWGTWGQGLPLRMTSAAPECVVGVAVVAEAAVTDVVGVAVVVRRVGVFNGLFILIRIIDQVFNNVINDRRSGLWRGRFTPTSRSRAKTQKGEKQRKHTKHPP